MSQSIGNENRKLATIRLKLRFNRSRERREELITVPAPRTREGQLNQLTAIVTDRFPGAELRVFHEGAGSFTLDDLHLVAAYVEDPLAEDTGEAGEPADSTGEDIAAEQLRLTA